MILEVNKPPKTVILWNNINEKHQYSERIRFDNWKQKGHYYFDKIWLELKIMERSEAYEWLAEKLNIKIENTHFSKLAIEQIKEAIYHSQQLLNDMRRLDMDFGDKPKTPYYSL